VPRYRELSQRGQVEPIFAENISDVSALLADIVRDGDIVITQGAGSIGRLAQELSTRFGEGEPS
jgi:UDP-N-acetylmuramate--alanine ligase